MLLSMTGFGNADHQSEMAHVSVELKAVNNRYFKLSQRLPDFAARFEPDIEKLVRQNIARGALQLSVRIRLTQSQSQGAIDVGVAENYLKQIAALQSQTKVSQTGVGISDLLMLPGVISEAEVGAKTRESLWPAIETAINTALQHFHAFREREGESMKQDLTSQCAEIRSQLQDIETAAPDVVTEYREKLHDRISKAFAKTDVSVQESDLLREVAVFADRCDINEEITRLKSHLSQFDTFLNGNKSLGKKLEFVGQEMFREINTIGSKANHVGIAHGVVEMKTAIERIREILANVE